MTIRDMLQSIYDVLSYMLDAEWVGYFFLISFFICFHNLLKGICKSILGTSISDSSKKWYYEDQGDYYATK